MSTCAEPRYGNPRSFIHCIDVTGWTTSALEFARQTFRDVFYDQSRDADTRAKAMEIWLVIGAELGIRQTVFSLIAQGIDPYGPPVARK